MPARQHNPAMIHLGRSSPRFSRWHRGALHHRASACRAPVSLRILRKHCMAMRTDPFHAASVPKTRAKRDSRLCHSDDRQSPAPISESNPSRECRKPAASRRKWKVQMVRIKFAAEHTHIPRTQPRIFRQLLRRLLLSRCKMFGSLLCRSDNKNPRMRISRRPLEPHHQPVKLPRKTAGVSIPGQPSAPIHRVAGPLHGQPSPRQHPPFDLLRRTYAISAYALRCTQFCGTPSSQGVLTATWAILARSTNIRRFGRAHPAKKPRPHRVFVSRRALTAIESSLPPTEKLSPRRLRTPTISKPLRVD